LHVHAFLFNLGKHPDSTEWSALDNKAQFDHKMIAGMLFRTDLAYQLAQLGFQIIPDRQYFQIKGITEHQRQTLSKRRTEIQDFMKQHEGKTSLDADIAALNTRSVKAEPPYLELIGRFQEMVAELGLTSEYVASLRSSHPSPSEDFSISPKELLEELTQSRSTIKIQDVLHLICKKAMGVWSAEQCRNYLDKFLAYEEVLHLGSTEHLTQVITSKSMYEREHSISDRVRNGLEKSSYRIRPQTIKNIFDSLRQDLSKTLGHSVSLEEQEAAAQYICSESGNHAFVVGSAGTGKTTLLKAITEIYRSQSFEVFGCAQSASAALNLGREAKIHSSTIASLLLRHQKGTQSFSSRTVLILDEAGVVGSREFDLLQRAVIDNGGKLVCVGDYKQHAAIEAGGIFRSLIERYGGASITKIQRQRTDFEPIYRALGEASRNLKPALSQEKITALRSLSIEEQSAVLDNLAEESPLLANHIRPWQAISDFYWMREVVDQFSKGHAEHALKTMAAKGQIYMNDDRIQAMDSLLNEWSKDSHALREKIIIAGLRQEVAELNLRARDHLISIGILDQRQSRILPTLHRDGILEEKEFAPSERIVFTQNKSALGLVNGATGTIKKISDAGMLVSLDEPNTKNIQEIFVPESFKHFDYAYSTTTFKSQGRTVNSAYVFINPEFANREWTYVAASRTRYRTSFYVPINELDHAQDEDLSHLAQKSEDLSPIQKLARIVSRSQVKSTTLDYENGSDLNRDHSRRIPSTSVSQHQITKHSLSLKKLCKEITATLIKKIKERVLEQDLHR
jgi:ATP-dependent exoDNAse (exonuclease V) alpha subunit